MRIEYFEQINATSAVTLAVEAWKYLLDNNLCQDNVMVHLEQSALVAYTDENTPIGIITYEVQKHSKSYYILLGYVSPNSRQQGVYRLLWNALVARAKEEKINKIVSSAHVNNKAMREAAKKLGREESGVILNFQVK